MRKQGSSARILCSTSETFCSSPRFFGCTARPNTGDRQLERPGVHVRVLGRVVQDVVELDLVDLGDGADVARDRLVHFDLRLAAQQVEVAGLDRLAALADVELRARRDAALVHAEHREAADVGIDLDLEHVRERVLARIGHRLQLGVGSPSPASATFR